MTTDRPKIASSIGLLILTACLAGCLSPNTHTESGAMTGGLIGAGTGALVGSATGDAGIGAAIGAGLGTLTGASIGSEVDHVEAENRAITQDAIAQERLHQQAIANAVSMQDILTMNQNGLDKSLIINQIQATGVTNRLSTNDLITLQQQGVDPQVIGAMQTARIATPQIATPIIVEQAPPAVIVRPRYPYARYPRHRIHVF
jgi:uncharacterized protein YcfJ